MPQIYCADDVEDNTNGCQKEMMEEIKRFSSSLRKSKHILDNDVICMSRNDVISIDSRRIKFSSISNFHKIRWMNRDDLAKSCNFKRRLPAEKLRESRK